MNKHNNEQCTLEEVVVDFLDAFTKMTEIDFLLDYLWAVVEKNGDQNRDEPIIISLSCDNWFGEEVCDEYDGIDLANDILGLYYLISTLPNNILKHFPRHVDLTKVAEENWTTLHKWAMYSR
ncbi:MAG: hypothetical protein GF349_00830 [Candidatus Magasanikbacteria bacterium]|nr:hypothetical protein [Candidatus Magasanikbacteria bacterium]